MASNLNWFTRTVICYNRFWLQIRKCHFFTSWTSIKNGRGGLSHYESNTLCTLQNNVSIQYRLNLQPIRQSCHFPRKMRVCASISQSCTAIFLYKSNVGQRGTLFYILTMKRKVYCCDATRDLYEERMWERYPYLWEADFSTDTY